jgi:hypothetical protein
MKTHLSLLFAWGLMILPAIAQKSITSGPLADTNGALALEVRSVFDPMPPTGYAPLRVVATNHTSSDRLWDFSLLSQTQRFQSENQHRSRFQMIVSAGGTESAQFLVPLAVSYGEAYGRSGKELQIGVNIDGARHRDFSEHSNPVYDFPAIAISKALADTNHSRLKDEVEKRMKSASSRGGSTSQFGSVYAAEDLPEDWLGLSGFDVVMMTDSEWLSLKPGQRLAMIQWSRLGGQLDLYATGAPNFAALGIPSDVEGKIASLKSAILSWNGKDLDAEKTVARYWGFGRREKMLTENYTKGSGSVPNQKPDWGLLESIGLRQFASWQVIVFLVIFGILVGPVNLFVLAPPGKRHKLFITTPLLSIGASLLMVVIILFQDGLGGIGARLVLVNVVPEETSAYVMQEQACRTGVLLGGNFELKQPALIEPLALPDTPWVKLKKNANSQPVQLSLEGAKRSGNFFQSRAEQGQSLRAAVSTRARLELKKGLPAEAAPEIISALGFTVDTLFYKDVKGDLWQANTPLLTGQQVKLTSAGQAALSMACTKLAQLSEGQNKLQIEMLGHGGLARGSFVALASAAPAFTVETLPSVRWNQDQIIVFGSVTQP